MLKTIRLPTFKVRASGQRPAPCRRPEGLGIMGPGCWGMIIGAVLVGPLVLSTGHGCSTGRGFWDGWPLRCWLSQACTLLLLVLFIYDVFFVFITPFLTKVGLLCPPSYLSPSQTLADRPVLCRVATASWWRWLPGPRTHPPTRRYTTRLCGPRAESPSRTGGCEPPG